MKLNFPTPDFGDDMPEEIVRAHALIDQLSEEMAMKCAKAVDDEIGKAITMRLGTIDWIPMQMTGRLSRTIFMDGSEIMVLDGVPLMHIGPWVMRQVGPSTKLTATRECTHLKGYADGKPN